MDQRYFGIDAQSVIFERFEVEVIAIHLDRGIYCSLNPTAADIFELVAAQPEIEEIFAAMESRYSAEAGRIRSEVTSFLAALQAEGLIRPATSRGDGALPLLAQVEGRPLFDPPSMSIHRDMQELFLLDPVHDVSEAGWPETRPSGQ